MGRRKKNKKEGAGEMKQEEQKFYKGRYGRICVYDRREEGGSEDGEEIISYTHCSIILLYSIVLYYTTEFYILTDISTTETRENTFN